MKTKILAIILAVMVCSCDESFLDISPATSAGDKNLISNVNDLRIATDGVYDMLVGSSYYGGEYTLVSDLMGDLFMEPAWGSGHMRYYYAYGYNKVSASTSIYSTIYLALHQVNDILLKAQKIEKVGSYEANIAELRTLRALLHFDLVRMYGPLYSNLGKGSISADALGIFIATEPIFDLRKEFYRDKTVDVYNFIKKELEESTPLLPKVKRNGFINYYGGKALLAKVYLYMEENALALTTAEEIIQDGKYTLYTKDNYIDSWENEYDSESIFELATSESDNASYTSLGWIISENGYKSLVPTKDFLQLSLNDPNDLRFKLLVYSTKDKCYYAQKKYPGRDGNIKVNNPKVFRLSEVYLIAAEAAFKLSDNGKAGNYLTKIRENRTTTNPTKYLTSITLDDILYERGVELFGEGNRAWDLWRNQKSVVRYTTPQEKDDKGHTDQLTDGTVVFDFYKTIYPIAERELQLLPASERELQQNPGY